MFDAVWVEVDGLDIVSDGELVVAGVDSGSDWWRWNSGKNTHRPVTCHVSVTVALRTDIVFVLTQPRTSTFSTSTGNRRGSSMESRSEAVAASSPS